MTALANNFRTNDKAGDVIDYNVSANTQVWQGALVVLVLSTGLISPASDVAGVAFAGVAFEPVANVGGSAGANSGRVQKTGTFVYNTSGFSPTQANVGSKVYAVDDNTVALSSAHSVLVGTICGLVAGNQVRVFIDPFVN